MDDLAATAEHHFVLLLTEKTAQTVKFPHDAECKGKNQLFPPSYQAVFHILNKNTYFAYEYKYFTASSTLSSQDYHEDPKCIFND